MPSDVDRRSEADRKKGAPASRTSAVTKAKAVLTEPVADDALAVAAARKAETDKRIAKLWRDYKKAPTQAVRNQLIEHYLPLVRSLAERLTA
jgi:hypothetical protein